MTSTSFDVSPTIDQDIEQAHLDQYSLLLSPRQFHEALGGSIGINSIYELIRAGTIKSVRLGRKILIPRRELIDFPHRASN